MLVSEQKLNQASLIFQIKNKTYLDNCTFTASKVLEVIKFISK